LPIICTCATLKLLYNIRNNSDRCEDADLNPQNVSHANQLTGLMAASCISYDRSHDTVTLCLGRRWASPATLILAQLIFKHKVVASPFLVLVLLRFELVDPWSEICGVSAESDLQLFQEPVHAME